MLRMLDVLADDGRTAAAEHVGQPGLGDLADLVEHARRFGCRMELEIEGDLGSVPADASLSAFRIVQEGLTNALKHGGARSVTVGLACGPTGLEITVDDDGAEPSVSAQGSGNGLIGMAERVALYAGTLRYGPEPGGGWSVRACIPFA